MDWKKYVEIDPRYFRPSEVDALLGDASKAEKVLGWKPKTTFKDLVKVMVEADLKEKGFDKLKIKVPKHIKEVSSAAKK
jgi:GDPmannose 4,6-dehydratase